MAFLANGDVVVHGNAERLGDIDDRLRHLDVGAGRSGIARGMIVQETPLIASHAEKLGPSSMVEIIKGRQVGTVVLIPAHLYAQSR